MPSLSPTQVSNLASHSADLPRSNFSPFQFQSFSIPPITKDASLNLISDESLLNSPTRRSLCLRRVSFLPNRLLSLPHQQHQTKPHQQTSINNLTHYHFSQNSTPRSSMLTWTIFRTLNSCSWTSLRYLVISSQDIFWRLIWSDSHLLSNVSSKVTHHEALLRPSVRRNSYVFLGVQSIQSYLWEPYRNQWWESL